MCACYGDEEVYQGFPGIYSKRKEMVKLSPGKETATFSADSKGYQEISLLMLIHTRRLF